MRALPAPSEKKAPTFGNPNRLRLEETGSMVYDPALLVSSRSEPVNRFASTGWIRRLDLGGSFPIFLFGLGGTP